MTDRRRLDRSRPFGIVYGLAPHRFEQDGRCFDAQGNEVLAAASAPLRPPQALPVGSSKDRRPQSARQPASEIGTTAAERMRRTRRRRRRGVVAVIAVEITQADIDRFVTRNVLGHANIGDRKAVAAAVRRALDEWPGHRSP